MCNDLLLVLSDTKEPPKQVTDIIQHSFQCFENGIQAFEALGDKINMALLTSNRGRLMRLTAQGHAGYLDTGQREYGAQERHYFNKVWLVNILLSMVPPVVYVSGATCGICQWCHLWYMSVVPSVVYVSGATCGINIWDPWWLPVKLHTTAVLSSDCIHGFCQWCIHFLPSCL